LPRFKIVDDCLHAVDSHQMNIFGIEDLDDVFALDIETIFNRDNYLFVGSIQGMYNYDVSIPARPTFVSEF